MAGYTSCAPSKPGTSLGRLVPPPSRATVYHSSRRSPSRTKDLVDFRRHRPGPHVGPTPPNVFFSAPKSFVGPIPVRDTTTARWPNPARAPWTMALLLAWLFSSQPSPDHPPIIGASDEAPFIFSSFVGPFSSRSRHRFAATAAATGSPRTTITTTTADSGFGHREPAAAP